MESIGCNRFDFDSETCLPETKVNLKLFLDCDQLIIDQAAEWNVDISITPAPGCVKTAKPLTAGAACVNGSSPYPTSSTLNTITKPVGQ